MLPRKDLIPLKKEFSRIRSKGKTYDSPSFGLVVSYGARGRPQAAFAGGFGGPRAAFIVSKKISLKSVVRHEVKRKLAEAIGKFLPRLPKSLELVFLTKPKAVLVDKKDIEAEIESVLRRARLI